MDELIKSVLNELGDTKFYELISQLKCENQNCEDYSKSPIASNYILRSDGQGSLVEDDIYCNCGELEKKVKAEVLLYRQKSPQS